MSVDPILITTRLVTNDLSDEELRALYAFALSGKPLEGGIFTLLIESDLITDDPAVQKATVDLRKVATLFPKANERYMHRRTLETLKGIVEERLGETPLEGHGFAPVKEES